MLFFVLLGAVAIDLGNWFVHKRHLQTQVDAAALAGGGLFGRCFVPGAPADTEILNEATKYSGASGSLYNGQVGNANTGTITMLYQSKTYASGGPAADDTATTPPCTSLMLDVKGTEDRPRHDLQLSGHLDACDRPGACAGAAEEDPHLQGIPSACGSRNQSQARHGDVREHSGRRRQLRSS